MVERLWASAMSKPYIPTFEIIVRRSFDGKVEGERSWKLSAAGSYVDKLEDAIAFVADAAMDAYGMRTAAASSAETKPVEHSTSCASNYCYPPTGEPYSCSCGAGNKTGRPNIVTRTVWTKNRDNDPYCVHCGKTWDMHLCDGFSSCPTAKTPLELSPSEAASFDNALARSPRRVTETKSSEGYDANGSLVAECPSTHSGHHIPGEKYKVCWYCQL